MSPPQLIILRTFKILILFIPFILIGCQPDEIIESSQSENSRDFHIETVKIANLRDDNSVLKLLEKYLLHSISSSKIKTLRNAEFQILGDETRYVESMGYKSYTFPVTLKNKKGGIYNLVLSSTNEEEFRAHIVEYNLKTTEILSWENEGKLNLENKINFYPVDIEMGDFFPTNKSQTCYAYVEEVQTSRATGWDVTVLVLKKVDCSGGSSGTGSYPNDPYYDPGYPQSPGDSDGTIDWNGPDNLGGGGTGSSSPGGNNEMVDGEEIMTAPMMRFAAIAEISNILGLATDSLEREWLINESTEIQLLEINNYLANNDSLISKYFVNEAIHAWMAGGDVDFEEHVILDDTFNSNRKVKRIYNQLKGLSNTVFNDIITGHFSSSKESHIKFDIGPIPSENNFEYKARTYASYNGSEKFMRIRLKNTFVENASTMEIALAIIHELVHAELLVRSIQSGLVLSINSNGTYTFQNYGNPSPFNNLTVFNSLTTYYKNLGDGNPQWNHDQFNVFGLREGIKENLLAIHPWLDNPTDPFENYLTSSTFSFNSLSDYFSYLAWAGLEGTQEYLSLPSTEKAKISFAINLLNNYTKN